MWRKEIFIMHTNVLNLHITSDERKRWNSYESRIRNVENGLVDIKLGNGVKPGLSTNDFSNEYKRKLDSIEWGANNYIHPPTHPASMIVETSDRKFVSSSQINYWNNKQDKLPYADHTHDGIMHHVHYQKLEGIDWHANNYIHPPTHPASMITGLATVATTGNYNDLIGRPVRMIAEGGNCDTINGIRILIQPAAPANPQINKEIWINPNDRLIRIFTQQGWQALYSIWA